MKRFCSVILSVFLICFLINISPAFARYRSDQDSNTYWYGPAKYPEATIYGEDIVVNADTNKVVPFEIKLRNHADFLVYSEFSQNQILGMAITVFDPSGRPSNSAKLMEKEYRSAKKDNPFGLLSTTMANGTLGKYEQYPENIDKIFKYLRDDSGKDFIYGDSYNDYDYLLPYEGFNLYLPSQPDEVGGSTATGYVFIQEGAAAGTYCIDASYISKDYKALVTDVLNITILPKVQALSFVENENFMIEGSGRKATENLSTVLEDNDLLISLTPLFTDTEAPLTNGLDPEDGYLLYRERSSKYVAGTVKRTSVNGPLTEEEDVWIYYSPDENNIYLIQDGQLTELSDKKYKKSLIELIKKNINFEIDPTTGATIDRDGVITFTRNGEVAIRATYNGQNIPVVSSRIDALDASSDSLTVMVSGLIQQFRVTASVSPESAGTVSGSGTYEEGSTAVLRANPASGYRFSGWYNGSTLVSTENPYNFTVTGNIELYARFSSAESRPSTPPAPGLPANPNLPELPGIPSIPVETPSSPGETPSTPSETDKVVIDFDKNINAQGSITGTGTYTKGEVVQLTAEPKEDYHFSGWAIDGKIITDANPLPFELTEDTKLEPVFTRNGDKEPVFNGLSILETNKEETKGTVIGTGHYAEGMKVTLIASPADGYVFDHWEVTNGNMAMPLALNKLTENPYTFVAKRDLEIEAIFAEDGVKIPEDSNPETYQTIYRLYNTVSQEHLYTTDVNEKNTLSVLSDWNFEGSAWESPSEGEKVYRLYSPATGNHLYTTDQNEYKVLTTERGWIADNNGRPVFYSGGKTEIYRLYNESILQHLLTIDKNEYNSLKEMGWTQEGVALYSR